VSKLSKSIIESHAAQGHSPYASLRSAATGDAPKPRGDAPTQNAAVEPDCFTAELNKLESFMQALYATFLAALKSGIPSVLVDFAAAYISAFRLQLSLKGFSAIPTTSIKAPMFNAGRGK
jgi:hypothetical protein